MRLASLFIFNLMVWNCAMGQVNVQLSINDAETGHPLRLPVRITDLDGKAVLPFDADIPAIYLDHEGNPRDDAFFYVDGSAEIPLPVGEVQIEVAGAFSYHFFKKAYLIEEDSKSLRLSLTPWEKEERLPQDALPIGDAALWTYASSLDGCLQAFQISIPADYDPDKPCALRFHLHGHGGGHNVAPFADRLDRALQDPHAICVSPICRGDAHYQGMGEYEFLEIFHGLQKALAIDLDHVTVEGYSMGGAGTWHLAGRFPYLFSAAFPRSGYLDYTVFLWTARSMDPEGRMFRDGGYGRIKRQAIDERLTYWRSIRDLKIEDWQVPLYERQGTIGVLENTLNLPMMITHGSYDMSIFGGVDVENSRRAWSRYLELGHTNKSFFEMPKAGLGHGGPWETLETKEKIKDDKTYTPEMEALSERLLNERRDSWPRRVMLRTNTLKYNRNAWVEVDALHRHWRDTQIEVELSRDEALEVTTRNVKQFTLQLGRDLIGGKDRISVTINRKYSALYDVPDTRLLTLRFEQDKGGNGLWFVPRECIENTLLKRHGLQGPIIDAFHQPHVILAADTNAEQKAKSIVQSMRMTNGGWLCSLMPCSQHYHPLIRLEERAQNWETEGKNLILVGTAETSPELAKRAGLLPVVYSPELVQFGVRVLKGEQLEICMVYPDPLCPERYLVWCTPGIPMKVIENLWRLPDFVAVENGEIRFTGFFDENWQPRND